MTRLNWLPANPAPEVILRRDTWLASHRGWKITYIFGLPGWWEATLDGAMIAGYDDLGDLMDRLVTTY